MHEVQRLAFDVELAVRVVEGFEGLGDDVQRQRGRRR